jgi:hypothetical protein
MKKALLAPALLMFALACRPSDDTSKTSVATTSKIPKTVYIGINEDPANPGQFMLAGPIPDPICISKKAKDKFNFCVIYNCRGTGAATITIDGFREQKDSSKRDPFKDGNSFTIAFAGPGSDCDKVTGELKDVVAAGEYYKFTIRGMVNGRSLAPIDPGVIISD